MINENLNFRHFRIGNSLSLTLFISKRNLGNSEVKGREFKKLIRLSKYASLRRPPVKQSKPLLKRSITQTGQFAKIR